MGVTTVIYGAGTQGKKLYHFLEKLHVKVDLFCQTYVYGEKKLFGVPLASFNNLISIEGEIVFFLAIVDKAVCNQISRRIHSIFLDRAVIIDYNCFMNTDYICDKLGYCNLCNSSINAFIPGGLEGIEQVSLFKEHHIIGGGYRVLFLPCL